MQTPHSKYEQTKIQAT